MFFSCTYFFLSMQSWIIFLCVISLKTFVLVQGHFTAHLADNSDVRCTHAGTCAWTWSPPWRQPSPRHDSQTVLSTLMDGLARGRVWLSYLGIHVQPLHSDIVVINHTRLQPLMTILVWDCNHLTIVNCQQHCDGPLVVLLKAQHPHLCAATVHITIGLYLEVFCHILAVDMNRANCNDIQTLQVVKWQGEVYRLSVCIS